MNNLISFKIQGVMDCNDHEVRIFIDNVDLIATNDNTQMGISPVEFLKYKNLMPSNEVRELLVARCDCGCVGCYDWSISLSREDNNVIWVCNERIYKFDYSEYAIQIESVKNSKDWENVGMVAERLVASLDFTDLCIKFGFIFLWASSRNSKSEIVLAFKYKTSHAQILLSVPWDGVNPGSAVLNTFDMIKDHPFNWNVKVFLNNVQIPKEIFGPNWII